MSDVPGLTRMALPARFWARVEQTDTCWVWHGATLDTGYGRLMIDRRWVKAHRYAYELLRGPVPAGMDLDHLCRVRHCVNPDHLEPVTRRENLRRGEGWAGRNAAKTRCLRGHPFTPENTYRYGKGRQCRTCHRLRQNARYHARKAIA